MKNHIATNRVYTGTVSNPLDFIPKTISRLPVIAAGIASTPTTNNGEVVKKANTKIGHSEPYNP